MAGRVSKGALALLPAAAAFLSLSCAGPERPVLATGSRLAELPAGYALILGCVRVSVDGQPVVCPPSEGTPACGLSLRQLPGGTFLIPHQSYPGSLDVSGEREPCFVLRLPGGRYEVERFEVSAPEVPGRFDRRSGNAVPVKRRFSVKPGEVVYVGTLVIDLPMAASKGAGVRVVEEEDRARAVAAEVEPEAGRRLVSRPMR